MAMELLHCDHTLGWQGLSPPSPSIPGGIRFCEAVSPPTGSWSWKKVRTTGSERLATTVSTREMLTTLSPRTWLLFSSCWRRGGSGSVGKESCQV